MVKSVATSITIAASCSEIWNCLTDFPAYGDWNPFIQKIDGKPGKGEKLSTQLHMVGGGKMKFKPQIVAFEPHCKLAWMGRFVIPGLFDGRHEFELISHEDGSTTFKQSEVFSGILVPLVWRGMEEKVVKSFEKMNEALKSHVEQRAAA